MSATRMLLIDQQKNSCVEFMEYSNSWGSAPIVWNIFSEKYWGMGKSGWLPLGSNSDSLQDFWNLYRNNRIPLAHRAVFTMTFDRALITRGNYERAISDIKKFIQEFSDYPGFWAGVNHWPQIAFDIAKVELHTNAPAIGFHMTTVSQNPFTVYDDDGNYVLHPDLYDLYAELDNL